MSKPVPEAKKPAPPPPPAAAVKPARAANEQDEEEEGGEDFVDQVDEAEAYADALEERGGARSGGGGGCGRKGGHGSHQERVNLHSGKGTRHKVELLEHARRSVSPEGQAKGKK